MNIKIIAALALAALSAPAFADTYQVTFGWSDPTTYLPAETPVYSAKYRVAGGAETVIPGLATPGGSATVTATPGQPIELSGQACSGALCSPWMAWVTATAPHQPTTPADQTGMTITVTRTGP